MVSRGCSGKVFCMKWVVTVLFFVYSICICPVWDEVPKRWSEPGLCGMLVYRSYLTPPKLCMLCVYIYKQWYTNIMCVYNKPFFLIFHVRYFQLHHMKIMRIILKKILVIVMIISWLKAWWKEVNAYIFQQINESCKTLISFFIFRLNYLWKLSLSFCYKLFNKEYLQLYIDQLIRHVKQSRTLRTVWD